MSVRDMDVGVALASLAEPPVMESAKSDASTDPLAPAVLNVSSLNVTATEALSSLMEI